MFPAFAFGDCRGLADDLQQCPEGGATCIDDTAAGGFSAFILQVDFEIVAQLFGEVEIPQIVSAGCEAFQDRIRYRGGRAWCAFL